MNNIIYAPFSDEQVIKLNEFQKSKRFHPFTCGGCDRNRDDQGILIATNDGWVCPCGKYKQDWADSFMVENK